MRERLLRHRNPLLGVVAVGAAALLLLLTVQGSAAADPMNVTSISPASGPLAGGTVVTITGTDLPTAAINVEVTFDGEQADIVTTGLTELKVKTPARAAAGPVAVVVKKLSPVETWTDSDGFTYVAAPTVSGVAPSPSPANSVVTVYGVNFAENATVKFGTASGTEVDVLNDHQIKVKVPAGTGTVDVTVTNPDTQTDTLDDAFTYGQAQGGGAPGTIISGSIPLSGGFGLFVFGGGTNQQLVTASGCPQATATFYTTNVGGFVVYIPGSGVQAVNAAWNALYASGIPATTALIGKCV